MPYSLAEPPSTSVLGAGAQWIEQLLTGSLVFAIATVAIALIGLAMLGGHASLKRGARVLLGCFLLFGAHSIAVGLRGVATSEDPSDRRYANVQRVVIPPNLPTQNPAPNAFDPYAGAGVPTRQ